SSPAARGDGRSKSWLPRSPSSSGSALSASSSELAPCRCRSQRRRRRVLENAAAVVEADGGVDTLGPAGRLDAGSSASACAPVVQIESGQRRRQTAVPGTLDGRDVV